MKCIGTIKTRFGDASINVGRYPSGGAVAVALDTQNGESITTFSTNLTSYGAQLAQDEFCVKLWSANEEFVAPMLATGLFEDTGRRHASGHVQAPIWRLKDPAHVPT